MSAGHVSSFGYGTTQRNGEKKAATEMFSFAKAAVVLLYGMRSAKVRHAAQWWPGRCSLVHAHALGCDKLMAYRYHDMTTSCMLGACLEMLSSAASLGGMTLARPIAGVPAHRLKEDSVCSMARMARMGARCCLPTQPSHGKSTTHLENLSRCARRPCSTAVLSIRVRHCIRESPCSKRGRQRPVAKGLHCCNLTREELVREAYGRPSRRFTTNSKQPRWA